MNDAAGILERARRRGWKMLPEPEGFALLQALGLEVPRSLEFERPEEVTQALLAGLHGDLVVLKAICPDLSHKTDVGGVSIVAREVGSVRLAALEMTQGGAGPDLVGFLLQEWVDSGTEIGSELLVNLRWDREFGPLLTCGPGGVHSELLGSALRQERALTIVTPGLLSRTRLSKLLTHTTAANLMTTAQRGRPARVAPEVLVDTLTALYDCAETLWIEGVEEIEINPLVAYRGGLIPLDVLVRMGKGQRAQRKPRPIEKLGHLLEPRSIAIVGVSRRLNPGRMILKNNQREGFDPGRVHVIKPGGGEIEGCQCLPSLDVLPERADLLIVAVNAEQVPTILQDVIQGRHAESVIVIPGGLDEKPGGKALMGGVLASLRKARESDWRGPVVNGGNCMGIRSSPGQYDTFFLPDYKLPAGGGADSNAAMVAQSGAFLAARSSKMSKIPFKYSISIGNQVDLTVGDYLSYLAEDADLQVIALYVEGFESGDGLRFLELAEALRCQGRKVILYRAGRTEEGILAAASHTASLAGSYATTVALARSVGVQVAESMEEFEDLVALAVRWTGRPLAGTRIAGLSNAGFECVALSDHLEHLALAEFTPETEARFGELLLRARVNHLVEVHNPLDVTPMMGDELFAEAAAILLADPNVDVGVIGCVPLTGALQTLPAASSHNEDLEGEHSIASRLAILWQRSEKPWIAVVDGGRQYDAFSDALEQAGVPSFRSMDRAIARLEAYIRCDE
jgi:acyl-CoA synthetase (NDP forming)